jgi:hypothetical protein
MSFINDAQAFIWWGDRCLYTASAITADVLCAHCYLLLFAIPCWWTSDDDQLQQLNAAAVARIMMLIPTAAKGKIILMHTHSDCAFDLNVDVIEVVDLIECQHWPCKQWPRSACDCIDKYTISNNAMMRVEKPSLYLVPSHVTAAPAPNGIIKQRSWQQQQSYNKEDCCCCNNDNVELFPRTLELVDTGITE